MLTLVKFIRNNGFDKRLFAYTSLDRLVITIYDPPVSNKESLLIKFDEVDRKWHFEYRSTPHIPAEMDRYYPEEQGIDKFCQFTKLLKW